MMTLKITDDDLLTIEEVVNYLPTRPHLQTVRRWTREGIQGTKLETLLVGNRRVTSKAALQRFVDAVSAEIEEEAP